MPAPVLLDLGTGTGQVPRSLLPVLPRLVHIDLVDVNGAMLEAARAALEPVRGGRTVDVFTGAAHKEADWTTALRELIQSYLGKDRRAGTGGTYAGPGRSYEDDLADSAFSEVTEHRFPVSRAWAPEDVLGYLRTTSFARPALFAGRHHTFEAAALRLLQDHAAGGVLEEDTVFTVLLARRPGGDA
ncbi:hypothetical protein ACIRBY_31915 [Streptomyces sp. NPDC096136]|uniref:hypothetical protein n=1 Tax=Streptomyces sp. NPDC096136 TaxID=3366076 RepID=UPI0037FD0B63